MKFRSLLVTASALLFAASPAFATRTDLTPFAMSNLYSDAAPTVASLKFTRAAGDASNFNSWKMQNGDILIAKNGGGSAYTLTVHSVKDAHGRTADLVLTLAATDEIALQIPQGGYKQSDGKCYVDVSNTSVTLAILRRP